MGIFNKAKNVPEITHAETCMCGKCTGLGSIRDELAVVRKEVVNDRRYHEYVKTQKIIDTRNDRAMSYLKSLISKDRKGRNEQEKEKQDNT